MAEATRSRRSWIPRLSKNSLFKRRTRDKSLEELVFSDLYVVHSLPKVGGMSIAATLAASFKGAKVFHVHSLSEKGFRTWRMALPNYTPWGRSEVTSHLNQARKAAMLLEVATIFFPTSKHRAIIGGVREPISWALSLFFESYRSLFGEDYQRITAEMVREFVIKVLTGQMSHLGPPCAHPEKWMYDEFVPAHGFNPLSCDFDIKKGYQIYTTHKHPVLIVRQENLSSLAEALSAFLGYPAEFITSIKRNAAESKEYSDIYRSIRNSLKFDDAFLRSVYSDAYSTKFYSPEERASFTSRWKF